MTALTRGKVTPFRDVDLIAFPVAANTHIFEGGIVQRAAAGGGIFPARSGSAGDENLVIVGVADQTVDNNPGTAGARTCLVRLPHNCLFEFATSSDLALANIGDLYDILGRPDPADHGQQRRGGRAAGPDHGHPPRLVRPVRHLHASVGP